MATLSDALQLRDTVVSLVVSGTSGVTVDLGVSGFPDAALLRLLRGIQTLLAGHGLGFAVSADRSSTRLILALVGLHPIAASRRV